MPDYIPEETYETDDAAMWQWYEETIYQERLACSVPVDQTAINAREWMERYA